jgi:hypothetical protein
LSEIRDDAKSVYEKPRLLSLGAPDEGEAACIVYGSSAGGICDSYGRSATGDCDNGISAALTCLGIGNVPLGSCSPLGSTRS